jgi:hypothetical protein
MKLYYVYIYFIRILIFLLLFNYDGYLDDLN